MQVRLFSLLISSALAVTAANLTFIISNNQVAFGGAQLHSKLTAGFGPREHLRERIPTGPVIPLPNLPHIDDLTFQRMRWAGHLTHKVYFFGACPNPANTEKIRGINGTATGIITIDHPSRWIVVIMRGSVVPKDFFQDIQSYAVPYEFGGVPCPGCKLHHGFQYAVKGVINGISQTVAELKARYPAYKVIITGHSLGGSTCSIIASLLVQTYGPQTLNAYCEGAPRTGNDIWARFVESQFPPGTFYRITSTNDGAPRVPPAKFGFTHISREAWISKHPPQKAEEVLLCNGPDDMTCNAGKGGFLANAAHFKYFETYGPISSCGDTNPAEFGAGIGG
jgi:hypothetical protein